MFRRLYGYAVVSAAAILVVLPSLLAKGPVFRPDYRFQGSTLNDWQKLGDTTWTASNGVITADPSSSAGGWLMFSKQLQNMGAYAEIRCSGDCKAGLLVRAEKTATGWKGAFVSLTPGDFNEYYIQIDNNGKEVSRKKLAAGAGGASIASNGEGGLADAMGNISPENRAKMRTTVRPPVPSNLNLPDLDPKPYQYKPNDWNPLNVIAYRDMLDPSLGSGGSDRTGGLLKTVIPYTEQTMGAFALYAGGSGKVEFRNVVTKDLNIIPQPKEYVSPQFRAQHLNGFYFSWSTAVGDFNHDGIPDVMAGPYWYAGPDFTEAHEIYVPQPYNAGTDYPQTSMVSLAYDFTGDGWDDVLVISGSAGICKGTLYVNPRGASRHWDSYVVLDPVGNEDTLLADIDGDGKPEVIHAGNNMLQYSKPDPKDPTGKWITTNISEPGPWGISIGHGLGVGDINGDGRMDFINAFGWWEHPPAGTSGPWKYHPEQFGSWGRTQGGPGGAQIGVFDVNGDGLPDVVTALEGHGYGLAWFEQKRSSTGEITFVRHTIMDNFLTKNAGDVTFTEPHATTFADMNGDGIPDLIVGKRAMSHLYSYGDPDPLGPAVLYVYTVRRDKSLPGGAEFVPTLVHNMSGVGSHFNVVDLNHDGRPDITTSGIYGTFVFFNEMKGAAKTAAHQAK